MAAPHARKGMKKALQKPVVHGLLRVIIPSGKASAAPPLSTQLGQRGLNIATFCKDFNNRTAHMEPGVPLPVRVSVNPDRSYKMIINQPTATFFTLQAAGISRGAMQGGHETAGWITLKHVYEIACIKAQDPNMELTSLKQICELIIGSAKSCGVEVVRDYDPAEYGAFLKEREQVVQEQLQELLEKKEAKLLRK